MTALVRDAIPRFANPSANTLHSTLLAASFAAGAALLAWTLGGMAGLAVLLLAAAIVLVFEPALPNMSLLELYQAEQYTNSTSQISSLIEVLSYRAGLPKPPLIYVVPSATQSAFSLETPNGPAIALTEGLLRRVALRELAGIVAHEIVHIRNGDLAVFRLADWLSRLAIIMGLTGAGLALLNAGLYWIDEQAAPWAAILLLLAAPVLSSALQSSLPKTREEDADLGAARLTGDIMGLAGGVQHLDASAGTWLDDVSPPLPARRIPTPSLMRTHAPAKSRIGRLLMLADARPNTANQANASFDPLVIVEQPMVTLVGYGPGDMRPRLRWSGLWY